MSWLDEVLAVDQAAVAAVAGDAIGLNDGVTRTPQDSWHPADRAQVGVDDDGDGWS